MSASPMNRDCSLVFMVIKVYRPFLPAFYLPANGNAIEKFSPYLHQLLRHLLVENFLHGQGDDDFVAALEEGLNRTGRRRNRRMVILGS